MKKQLLFSILLVLQINAFAVIRTVNNMPNGGAQYTSIVSALAAANHNDTIYISGSTSSYETPITINKRITLIGPGFKIGGASQNTLEANIDQIYIDSSLATHGANRVKIMGMKLTYITLQNNVKNITIERCRFYNLGINNASNSGVTIRGCTFEHINNNSGPSSNNIEISNCAFKLFYNLTPNTTVNQCVIYERNLNTSHSATNTLFVNNIFYNTNIGAASINACTFSNNLIYAVNVTIYNLPLPGSNGAGNINQQDPLFVSSLPSSDISWPNIFDYNYRLQAGSPALTASSTGGQLGIYGGPFAMNQMGILPTIPQVNEINISNPAVPQNGTLNVNVKARKQN
jgi:hypothetical protein